MNRSSEGEMKQMKRASAKKFPPMVETASVLGAAPLKAGGPEYQIAVAAPKFEIATIRIRGTAPLVQHKFSAKLRRQMVEKQQAGSTATKGKKREPKDFEQTYRDAMHISREGWHGIPAPAFRSAMISACRLVGYKMTLAKLSVFVLADGFDRDDAVPLITVRSRRASRA
jgi:hypothetical protein